jgi:large repetitive protein
LNPNTIIGTDSILAVAPSTTTTYLVYGTNDTSSFTVNVVNTPSVNLGNDTTLCQGQSVTLNSGSATTYLWSNNSTASSINVSTSGTYWVQASNGQCSSTDSIIISINQYPAPNLGNDTTLCQGQTVTLNGGTATAYLWSNNSTASSIIASTQGTYWVQASNGQCSKTDSITISINQYPAPNLGNDTTLCQGQSVTLNSGAATSYLWSNNSTASSIIACSQGTYWVQASNGQCSAKDSITISMNQYPAPNLGNDTTLCQGQSVTLNGGAATTFLWSNNSTTSSIIASAQGTYWVQTSNGQCSSSDSITISVNQYPAPNLGNDTTLCQGQTVTLNGGAATTYLWSNGSNASTIIISSQGTYWVQASNEQCSASDTLNLLISDCEVEIEMPNVFTPNNDGVNDNFIPIKYKGISNANLVIYNRWGQKVFNTDDFMLGWNGTYKDNNCAAGTYFWMVQYTTNFNETKELKGHLTLIK